MKASETIWRALSVRQPYAELILRGEKTIEWRSRTTRIVGERFWIYASLTPVKDGGIWSEDLERAEALPWIRELGLARRLFGEGLSLPRGVIVGSAAIARVVPPTGSHGMYGWELCDVERMERPRRPEGHPQPVWFNAFG